MWYQAPSHTEHEHQQILEAHYHTVAFPNAIWKASLMALTFTSLSEATMISKSPPESVDEIFRGDVPSEKGTRQLMGKWKVVYLFYTPYYINILLEHFYF